MSVKWPLIISHVALNTLHLMWHFPVSVNWGWGGGCPHWLNLLWCYNCRGLAIFNADCLTNFLFWVANFLVHKKFCTSLKIKDFILSLFHKSLTFIRIMSQELLSPACHSPTNSLFPTYIFFYCPFHDSTVSLRSLYWCHHYCFMFWSCLIVIHYCLTIPLSSQGFGSWT